MRWGDDFSCCFSQRTCEGGGGTNSWRPPLGDSLSLLTQLFLFKFDSNIEEDQILIRYWCGNYFFVWQKIKRRGCALMCVKRNRMPILGTPHPLDILSYFCFSFYLNLIQTKKGIMSKMKGVGPTFCTTKIKEKRGCVLIKKRSSFFLPHDLTLTPLLPSSYTPFPKV